MGFWIDCPICGKIKPAYQFNHKRYGRGRIKEFGIDYRCKVCSWNYQKKKRGKKYLRSHYDKCMKKQCPQCGGKMHYQSKTCITCRDYCKEKNPNWNGGKSSEQYRMVKIRGKSFKLHRKVWISMWGKIPKGCVIHHIDHDKQNNSIENLAAVSRRDHAKYHNGNRLKFVMGEGGLGHFIT